MAHRLYLLTSFTLTAIFAAVILSGLGRVLAVRLGATSPLASIVFFTLLALGLALILLVLKVLARRVFLRSPS